MKLVISIFYFLFALLFGYMDVSEDIVQGLKSGKASDVVKNFDEKVSLKLVDQEDVLSRSQAEANLKNFFEKHPVKNFGSVHVSNNSNTLQYLTGSLETSNGKFRVSVLIKRSLVTQFRIENENE